MKVKEIVRERVMVSWKRKIDRRKRKGVRKIKSERERERDRERERVRERVNERKIKSEKD